MTQESKNFIDANDRGYQSISIPVLSLEEIASLRDVAVDQDLREKANSFVRRRRSLFVLVFCFVGALGLAARTRNATVDADISLLRSGVEVEETGSEVAVLSTDAQYSTFAYPHNQYCSGRLKIPPEFSPNPMNDPKNAVGIQSNGNPVPPFCRAENARNAFSEVIGTVGGKALEDTKVMEELLKKFFKGRWYIISISGGVWLGLGLTVMGFAYDLACANDRGQSPIELQINDVMNIAQDVVDRTVASLAQVEFQTALTTIETQKEHGFDPDDLLKLASDFHQVALKAAIGGYQATLLCSNAAKISILILNWLREESHQNGFTDCCGIAAARIVKYRLNYVDMEKRLRGSFKEYKDRMLDSSKWRVEYRNQWACASIWKGGYYNQYIAFVEGPNGKRLTQASSQQGWSGSCPSNGSKENEAKNRLRPMVVDRVNQVEAETFSKDVIKFYDLMAEEIAAMDCESPYPVPALAPVPAPL